MILILSLCCGSFIWESKKNKSKTFQSIINHWICPGKHNWPRTPCHVHDLVSCVCNLEKTPLRGDWLYPQSWLKHENDLFSGSGGKAVEFEFLKGFELLHMNRCTIWAKNLLCKNKKNHLWQVTLSSKPWHCSMKRKLKYLQVAGPLCAVLQSVSTE